jgi:uncharacterized protein (TIGR02145 family)
MASIKALLTGLVSVSLCMANISGIVTDTGTSPISCAIVSLETGGQKATTGADGSFTLVVENSGIISGNVKQLSNRLSARISGSLLSVMLMERAVVEVATFDLGGKVLSTLSMSMDAGCHSISLPYQGTGIYLYKLESGNSAIVLKGNSVNGGSVGSAVLSQGASAGHLAKKLKATAAINDVIAATKDGFLNYRCVIGNSDTGGIVIKMIANAGNLTDVDGNVYQSVRIGNQVWTVENLRTTRYNDSSSIPLDTSMVTWQYATMPKYCYYKNTTSSDSIKKYGALYNWYVISPTNPKKIAPAGWHVPSMEEWGTLVNHLIDNSYNWNGTTAENKIAKSLAAKTDWRADTSGGSIGRDLANNNRTGFTALPGGFRQNTGSYFYVQNDYGGWWSTMEYVNSATDAWARDLYYAYAYLDNTISNKGSGYSLRLVRD